MNFKYNSIEGISINGVFVSFLESRDLVRHKLGIPYVEQNRKTDLGNGIPPIIKRRDVYKTLGEVESFFFINYDKEDRFRDIEIHYCDHLEVFGVPFGFNESADSIALRLRKYSERYKTVAGEYVFFDLKIVIMSQAKIGGEGGLLGYFYCTSDISHLEKNKN